jgi:hypothetical protein
MANSQKFFQWRPHPWHGLEVGPNPPIIVHAYIEITPFDTVKYEVDKLTMSAKKHFKTEHAREIGDKLGIKWNDFDVEQFRMGLDVELEHGLVDPSTDVTGNDPILTGKIALAHLNEFADYYTRLEKMERKAEEEHARS